MSQFYLYDDAAARAFEPLALTRPASELRAGAELIRRRWERAFGLPATGFIGAPHLAAFTEPGSPISVCSDSDVVPGTIIANSRFAPSLQPAKIDPKTKVWKNDGKVVAVRVNSSHHASRFGEGQLSLEEIAQERGKAAEIPGRWMDSVWDFIGTLVQQLQEDIPILGAELDTSPPRDCVVIGKHPLFCEPGARIEPHVVFDLSAGPVLVRAGAEISAFTRITGPCYIGEGAVIIGDRVSASSIGEVSKVRGEISNTIVLGHSNKGHTGFLGHSYLGRWVNLGAGTTTSNMKNTYGSVQLKTADGLRNTKQQFLGTFFGDYAKTGIGTMLTTGTIVGAGANVFGSAMPPKSVPPFAWGGDDRYEIEKFLEVAERMMARRHVDMPEGMKELLRAAYNKVN
ncbi:MAG TPA: putative sugar nucleotidyl transferase [Gemmatimonadaceae bacterium]|nr:putative sugar nucleotidyl transferase [Gemmatimonadaceae bacterium]